MGDRMYPRPSAIAGTLVMLLAACGAASTSSTATTDTTSASPVTTVVDADTTTTTVTALPEPATAPSVSIAPTTNRPIDDLCPPGTHTTSGTVFHVFFEEVMFPAGASGTTVSGEVCPEMTNAYDFVAGAGQKLTLSLTSQAASLELWAPDGSVLGSTTSSLVVDPLPDDGRYSFLLTTAAEAPDDFSLQFEVTSPSTADAPSDDTCPEYVEFTTYPMRLCHKGDQVTLVQELLIALGHQIEADGYFGPSTAAAIAEEFDDGIGEIRVPSDLEQLRPD